MATLTLRNLDESLQTRLRTQAAVHGRTIEDEAVDIIRTALPTRASADRPNQSLRGA